MRSGSAITRYLFALAATIGSYALYSVLVVPLIDGSDQVSRARPTIDASYQTVADLKRKLIGLIPADGWEWQPCKILETRQGIILFEDYQPLDDGSVQLYPLTMVIGLPGNSSNPAEQDAGGELRGEAPTVLRAPGGAVLKFERPLTLTGDFGDLQSGRLTGEVQLFRPASNPQNDDSLALVTQNVQISPERIFTLYETTFRFGQSHGRGKHLVIDLGTTPNKNLRQTAYSGIHKIELAQIDQMYLHRSGQAASRDDDLLGNANRSLLISCQGPFVFDLQKLTASFSKKVSVSTAADRSDRLDCERLLVTFTVANHDPVENSMDAAESIEVTRLLAIGSPAVLTAKSQNAQAIAERIDYDLSRREVLLQSAGKVSLTRDAQYLEALQIRYTLSRDGRLGNATVSGPGMLQQQPTTDRDGMLCRWQKQLSIQDDGDKKVISLKGAVVSTGEMTMSAEQLHLWLWEIPDTTQPGGAPTAAKTSWTLAPAKLFAERQVKIESQKFSGNCGQAAAFWPTPASHAAHIGSLPRRLPWRPIAVDQNAGRPRHQPPNNFAQSRRAAVANAYRRVSYQEWVPQNASPQSLPRSPARNDQGDVKKIHLVGNQVQLQMRPGPDYAAIDEITVDGDVVIQQWEGPASQANPSLELRGQKLRAINNPEDLYRLFVFGADKEPAWVVTRGLTLSGAAIHLDQTANRLWIDGPGEMQLQPQPRSHDSPNRPPSTPGPSPTQMFSLAGRGPTRIQWLGGMVFDGQQIYFETQVQLETKQSNGEDGSMTVTTAEGAALSLVLLQAVDLRQSSETLKPLKFDLDTLVLVGRLDRAEIAFPKHERPTDRVETFIVSSKYDTAGKLVASQQIRAQRSEFKSLDSLAKCVGPGSLTIRQLATRGGTARLTSPSRRSLGPSDHAIEYIKIDFEDSLTGNLDQKQVTVSGHVHSHYDGIDRWNEVPDERRIKRQDGRGIILDCQQLKLDQWTPSSAQPNVEIYATGNVRAKGSQFDATAERISYHQLHDQVVIEAPSRANAELWFQRPGEKNRGHLVARKILYWLSDGSFEVQESKQIDYSHQGPIRGSR